MRRLPHLAATLVVATLITGSALAQATAPASAPGPGSAPTASTPAVSGTMDKKAVSQACSAKADQQGLHGKARRRFRSACKAGKA